MYKRQVQNRFYVRGEGAYLYQYNYGNIASDPRLAAMNFIQDVYKRQPPLGSRDHLFGHQPEAVLFHARPFSGREAIAASIFSIRCV